MRSRIPSKFPIEVFVLGRASLGGSELAQAAARAGSVGLLDLTYCRDQEAHLQVVAQFARGARGPVGVLLHARCGEFEKAVLKALAGGGCDTVLLHSEEEELLAEAVADARRVARRVGVICCSLEEAQVALRLGADLVVAKGQEAAGIVGEETAFILVQRFAEIVDVPIFVLGGMGCATAAACLVAGASGAILDSQVLMMPEAELSCRQRDLLDGLDGSESTLFKIGDGRSFRAYAPPGMDVGERLEKLSSSLSAEDGSQDPHTGALAAALDPIERREPLLLPIGQEIGLASEWASADPTLGRRLQAFQREVGRLVSAAIDEAALRPGGAMAESHGTTYPVVQGPMTRVSDVPAFCEAVADGGGLPFLALALMRKKEARSLVEETSILMEGRPWGVGILGFVEQEIRAEQISVLEEFKPPFAIIAGGRADQSAELEERGIRTYLHVPSPSMLGMFLEDGARRFIFEGRECGGHVGPRTSFVLWEAMTRTILQSNLPPEELSKLHILFAGGIHDARSGAMVSVLAQPLAELGVRVGVLLGTAYLFTEEIVSTGAIVPEFQSVALGADRTVTLDSGPGHLVRCADTSFCESFAAHRQGLLDSSASSREVRDALEVFSQGRLRIASKGIVRSESTGADSPRYEDVGRSEQLSEGMYMLGQVAALQDERSTISDLHDGICQGALEYLRDVGKADLDEGPGVIDQPAAPPTLDIAIVGMGCIVPGASDVETFWENIIAARDLIREIPRDRFDVERWFDADPDVRDKTIGRWGGFIDDIQFDPLKFGVPPAAIPSIEPAQLLALEVVHRALTDAGYGSENPHREKTCVILGAGGGLGELGTNYACRAMLPSLSERTGDSVWDQLPEWTEDSLAGILLNVIAGRVANRLDMGGVNFTVDAACGSSLAAVYLACRELVDGTASMAIAGGCDTMNTPFGYLAFSKTGALSPSGRCRAFDKGADGIVLSEGVAAVVLKRRADAERDGDRIYAVLRAVAGGSDGRSKSMTAPRLEGQVRTLERAYEQARFDPARVGLFEAHGTGTELGDMTECRALAGILSRFEVPRAHAAIGSLKSLIGHTKSAAGVAGLMKAALALHHRALPPTIHVTELNDQADLEDGPLYVNTELRPWIQADGPRVAGVSAFGFGGTNFHAVLEEYTDHVGARGREALRVPSQAELFLFSADSEEALAASLREYSEELTLARDAGAEVRLDELAYSLYRQRTITPTKDVGQVRASLVCDSVEVLRSQLLALIGQIEGGTAELPAGAYHEFLAAGSIGVAPPIAFLFPGQGSQFPDMLRALALQFPEVLECFELADRVLQDVLDRPLSRVVFPRPALDSEAGDRAAEQLKETTLAQPALGVCGVAVLRLLESFGVEASSLGGHSYGELVALHAAGCFDEAELYRLSYARGAAMAGDPEEDRGQMVAVRGEEARVRDLIEGVEQVWVANCNSREQVVISGAREGIARARALLEAENLPHALIPVACAFHTSLMEGARERFERVLEELDVSAPRVPTFSNVTADVYGEESESIRSSLSAQIVGEVRFADQVEVMYSAGARIFIEVGPGEVLTRLVTENLGDRPHLALPTAGRGGRDVETFLRALAQLYTAGHDVDDGRLYRGRRVSPIDLSEATKAARDPLPGHMWLVNGSYSRPAMEPPRVLRPKVASFGTEFAGTLEQDAPGMARAPEERALSAISAGSMQDAAGVMTQYLEMMRGFVEGQRSVMEAYLSGGAVSPVLPIPDGARPGLPAGEDAGAPGSSGELRLSNDVEPSGTAAEPEPTESAASPEAVLSAIIAKRTGYPEEMLDPAADLEADLGIDSIKRVEIIALLRRELFPDLAKPPRWFIEKVTSAASMNEICACVRELRETLGADDHSPQEGGRLYDAADHQPELEPEVILRSLVAKRTGYPEEMLEPDADLEADLGIDSIKRVEIIGLLRRSVFPSGFEPPRWFMERMTSALSMNDISAGVRELLAETAESAAPADSAFKDLTPERSEGSPDSPAEAPVVELRAPRCTVEIVESPLAGQNGALGSGMVLVTDDGEGYAEALMSSLRDRGVEPVLVALPHLANAEAAGDYIADLRGGSERITGLVHLLPTREAPQFPGITERQWAVQVDEEVKSLLFLMQALEPELASRTSTGFSILALTTGGGDFEPGNSDESAHPWRGAIAGLLKTAAIEWPRANFRAVDFDARLDCDQVLSELRASHEHVEVGYRHGRRLVQRPFPLELEEEVSGENLLGPESVILVTGGARGITAQVVLELASRTKATLVLLGRSPAPEEEEADETAALVSPDELRSALIQRRVAAGNKATIKEVEKELRELLRDREMRSIFSTLSSSDVRFEYVPCDVRDPDALEAVVADVVDRLGEIDVLIHGAGVIEDKKLVDKSADSFDRVVGTKVDPILTLARVLDLERLRLTVLFSSIAGVFGNAGQGDYAAASEILNRFACRLAGRATGRVVSINWGPWIGAGSMVTRDVAGMFAEKGIDLISVTAGREAAWREIACPSSKAVRVIIGGGFWLDGGPDGEPGRESNGKVHGRLNGDAMLSVELGEADA